MHNVAEQVRELIEKLNFKEKLTLFGKVIIKYATETYFDEKVVVLSFASELDGFNIAKMIQTLRINLYNVIWELNILDSVLWLILFSLTNIELLNYYRNSIFWFFFSFIQICLNEEGNTLQSTISVDIAKKELQKAIVNELWKKGVIDFCECNNIVKKLDEDIMKFENKLDKKENDRNMVVKIPL